MPGRVTEDKVNGRLPKSKKFRGMESGPALDGELSFA
jgi:hypothetical protein